jgi:predicted metal-dependent phosphoesterase TrpH
MTLQISVDFYCHSNASKDSFTSLESLVHARRYRVLDRLVGTDHNTSSGSIEIQALDPEMIIKGEEIMTPRGELLVIFVADSIPPGLPPPTKQSSVPVTRKHSSVPRIHLILGEAGRGNWKTF